VVDLITVTVLLVALVVAVVILVREQQQAVLVILQTHLLMEAMVRLLHPVKVTTVAVMQDLLAHLIPQVGAAVQAQQVEAHHLIL